MEAARKGSVMMEHHCANATTHTAASAGVSRLAANEIIFDEALGGHTQRATLVLGPGRAIYVGMGQSSTLHRHYATQLSISLGAPLQVRTRASGPYTEQQSFIVGPNLPHQVEMTGVPCFVLWSEARALADLARRLRTPSASELPALPDDLLNILLPILLASGGGQVPDKQAGQALLSHVLTQLLGPNLPDEGTDDPRIATALSLVTPQFLALHPQPITSLATCVHLSPSRFRHLFRHEMGMSVQSYLRWQRLLAALRTSAYGASLTEAAHVAGFADSAHLTRVCRATFGLPPARIFKHSHAVQVFPGAGC
jgi:AraC family transcriptional regulator